MDLARRRSDPSGDSTTTYPWPTLRPTTTMQLRREGRRPDEPPLPGAWAVNVDGNDIPSSRASTPRPAHHSQSKRQRYTADYPSGSRSSDSMYYIETPSSGGSAGSLPPPVTHSDRRSRHRLSRASQDIAGLREAAERMFEGVAPGVGLSPASSTTHVPQPAAAQEEKLSKWRQFCKQVKRVYWPDDRNGRFWLILRLIGIILSAVILFLVSLPCNAGFGDAFIESSEFQGIVVWVLLSGLCLCTFMMMPRSREPYDMHQISRACVAAVCGLGHLFMVISLTYTMLANKGYRTYFWVNLQWTDPALRQRMIIAVYLLWPLTLLWLSYMAADWRSYRNIPIVWKDAYMLSRPPLYCKHGRVVWPPNWGQEPFSSPPPFPPCQTPMTLEQRVEMEKRITGESTHERAIRRAGFYDPQGEKWRRFVDPSEGMMQTLEDIVRHELPRPVHMYANKAQQAPAASAEPAQSTAPVGAFPDFQFPSPYRSPGAPSAHPSMEGCEDVPGPSRPNRNRAQSAAAAPSGHNAPSTSNNKGGEPVLVYRDDSIKRWKYKAHSLMERWPMDGY